MVSAGKIHLSFLICDSKLDKPVNDLTLKLLRTRVRLPPGPPFFYFFCIQKNTFRYICRLEVNMHNLWPLILLGLIACDSDNKDTGNDTGSEDTALLEDTE